ncbi:MAG: outer membrane protein assembly factor BamB family protein [Planctomycetota bacterium]|jgi:outer membrane protein assembly factor BamB
MAARRGLIVQIGGTCPAPGEGRVIHYLLPDQAAVDKAKDTHRGQDSVRVDLLYDPQLPHAENIVRHLVCEIPGAVSREETMRVLRPLGTARLKTAQGWTEITKKWPDDIDEWTHWLHGPSSNPVAADRRVGPPRRLLWSATPRRSRSHEKSPSLTGMVSAKGRLFYINDEGPISLGGDVPDMWRLVGRDAFSGALLWKKPVPDWGWEAWSPNQPMNLRWGNPRFIHRRLVAVGDRVYVTLGYSAPVSVFDAETGKVIRTLAGTESTSEILFHNGLLVLSIATQDKTQVKSAPPLAILVVDPETGKIQWRSEPMPSLADLSERGKSNVLKQGRLMIAADKDRVVAATTDEIVGYALDSGKEVWRVARPALPPKKSKKSKDPEKKEQAPRKLPSVGTHNIGMLVLDSGRVYFGQPQKAGKVSNLITMTLLCLNAETGKELWRGNYQDWTYTTSFNVYAVKDKLVVHDKGPVLVLLDAATGQVVKRHDIGAVNSHHHHRCYRNKATEKYVLMGKEGVEYLDIETGEVVVNRWIRGTCLYGIMPANGLLYTSPAACACNQMNRLDGFAALAADTSGQAAKANNPLIKGPAYGSAGKALAVDAWPQYRRDAVRSGQVDFSPTTGDGWKVQLPGKLTAPVSDGTALYLGCDDQVVALSCADGRTLWHARGRIDSPPTLYKGLLLFGTRDGWIHCLRAGDGQLAWQFRAAPAERFILDDSRLESVWPLHGSLMLFKGRVYATAGRSSFIDGGLRIYALNPETGVAVTTSTFFTEQTKQSDYYEGVTNDLLVSDGESLFLKHMKIDPETLAISRLQWWEFSGPDGKLKAYDKSMVKLPIEKERTPVLSSASGFLDDEIFGRAHVQLDGAEFCNRLSFDAEYAYGVRHSQGPGHFQFHVAGKDGFPVLCFDRQSRKAPKKKKGRNYGGNGSAPADHRVIWKHNLPVRPSAILAVGDRVLVGGGPDQVDKTDPLRSFEWRAGGLLYTLNCADGKTFSEQKLSAPPVHEGLIAIKAGIFVCLKDGTVLKL